MAETEEIRDTFPRDLLQRFICGNNFPAKLAGKTTRTVPDENVELSLGLSLNGRFGVDTAKKLIRASSVTNFMGTDDYATTAFMSPFSPLPRTCSLPTETEEWRRKRKELQSLRRLEAKRKRVEKLKNVRVVKEKVENEQNSGEENGRVSLPNSGTCEWVELKSERGFDGVKLPQFYSQGSIGSVGEGSGSSGVSDFETRPFSGPNKETEVKSPVSEHSIPEQKPASSPETTNAKWKAVVAEGEADEMVKSMFADMPCVSTKGDGPNGRKIEGFLYRYGKGEEVRIVCVCHGSFLTPAEFVKHGGGGDVAHPLRHIVVNPRSVC